MDSMEDASGSDTGMSLNLCGSPSPIGLGPVSSPDYDLQQSNLALLKAELKLVTHDRDLLKKELTSIQQYLQAVGISLPPYKFSSGTLPRSSHVQASSPLRDYDALQRQCEAAMNELQSLKRQHDRCEKAVQESEYYRGQHCSTLSKLDATTQEMHSLRAKYGDMLAGKQRLEQEVHSLSQAREEDRKEINELRRQQQEVVIKGNGNNETLNQLYINTLRKYEDIKDEYDSLRKRYADLVASHSAAVSKLELAQEEMTRLKKQYEESIQERNGAVRERNVLKQQCTQAIMQWDSAIRERNTYKDFLAKIQLQHEEEVNKAMAVRIKASKDLKRLTEERNAAMEEYSLVMRERDTVHKEIEKLQDDLSQSNKKIKAFEAKNAELNEEKKMLLYQVESLRREIMSALDDRDSALKELNDIREKCGEYQLEPRWSENSALDDSERTNRFGANSGGGGGEQGARGKGDRVEVPKSSRGGESGYAAENGQDQQQEVEQLRKQLDKLQAELQEALQEAQVSKQRRDWAFGERDKVVLERESIRTLCDRLRRERDRAVSDLAEALRDSDDIKRQRNDVSKEVKELKEKLGEMQMEKDKDKEMRAPHNHSYDSALGTDLSDAETETVEVELECCSSGLTDFGFSLAGGKNRPVCTNDPGLYVVSVCRGGPADGKLKINDCLVKVANLNCTSVDCDTVWNLLRSTKVAVSLTVRRRRTCAHGLYSVKLHLGRGVPHGLVLDSGVYIRSVTPGSVAARESSLKSGDRLCSINGRPVDSMTSLTEVCRILDDNFGHNEGPVLTVVRGSPSPAGFPASLPSLGSPSSGSSSAHNMTEEDGAGGHHHHHHHHVDSHYSTSVRQGSKLSKAGSSNVVSSSASSTTSAGLGVWEIVRERFRSRRPHSKERVDGHALDGAGHRQQQSDSETCSSSQSTNADREAAVIAVLESVIDGHNTRAGAADGAKEVPGGSANNNPKKAELNLGLVTLNRRNRLAVQVDSNRGGGGGDDAARISSGGTWPRCRAGSPYTSGDYPGGTMFHSNKFPRARLPLSVFIDASKSSKEQVIVDDTDDEKEAHSQAVADGEEFHVYGDHTSSETVGCSSHGLGSSHAPSDGSIDLSVKSGNLGKEALGRYLKNKKTAMAGCKNDMELQVCRSSPASASAAAAAAASPVSVVSQVMTTASGSSGLPGPVHVHSAAPLGSNHLRIQSQLYGGPTTLHSSLKYKVSPHVHSHPHSPPRYSSPPPRAPENPYEFSLGGLLSKSYCHAATPSIDSIYSRPHNHHNHNHNSSILSTYDMSRTLTSRPECVPFDGTVKREPTRIRIPSNPSVTSRNSIGRISSSSIEHLSERASPMPNFHVEVLSPGRPSAVADSRSSLNEYSWPSATPSKFKPTPDELRRVYIEKSSEPLGIQIFCRNSGGVFVSSVHQSSLAAQVGLQVGDQLLEVCGINMRSATYQLAARVLHQCGDSITMLVQYNPAKYQELQELTNIGLMGPPLMTSSCSEGDGNGDRSRERSPKSRSGSPTPCNSPRPSRNNSMNSGGGGGGGAGGGAKDDILESASSTLRSPLHLDRLIERANENRSSIVRPPSIHGTLTRHHALATLQRPTSVISSSTNDEASVGGGAGGGGREPRLVYLEMKKAHSLGISLVGGNAVGIYIHAVQTDSPAYKAGLHCGDRILEFNGVNLREATAEQAAYELAKAAEKLTIVAQHDLDRYREIVQQPGDSFYVRAQFDKTSADSHHHDTAAMELCFRRDDILHVDNTMYNGVPGLWRAWLLDHEGRQVRSGVIPSKFKIEEELLLQQRSSLADLDHESRRSSTSARRSFFRRRKHTRSSSRDSKELASFSDASLHMGSSEGLGSSIPCVLQETSVQQQQQQQQRPLSYVRIDRLDCHSLRPVLIVGPLADCVMDKLVHEFPRKFARVAAELMRYPQSYMDKNLDDNTFIEYRRKGLHFECVTTAAVQSVAERNLHAILDVSLNAVQHLHQQRIYPVVLLLKFKSVKHAREVKDTRLPIDKIAAKAAKEMYEHVLKVEAEHRHLISAVIPAGGNLACICTQVAALVDQEQNKVLWVPRGSIW